MSKQNSKENFNVKHVNQYSKKIFKKKTKNKKVDIKN